MARNSSGTHSLPTGQPVVTGTTISSATHNTLASDLSAEITDSLSRSGKGPMQAPLELTDGTAAAPSLTFDSDVDTGFYRVGANEVGAAANGALVWRWDASGLYANGTDTVPLTRVPASYYASADVTTSANSATDITGLSFSVAATGVYRFEFLVLASIASDSTTLVLTLAGPASPTSVRYTQAKVSTSGGAVVYTVAPLSTYNASYAIVGGGTFGDYFDLPLTGVIVNGANAGTVKLQFQSLSGAHNVTVYKGSMVRVTRLA